MRPRREDERDLSCLFFLPLPLRRPLARLAAEDEEELDPVDETIEDSPDDDDVDLRLDRDTARLGA